MMRRFQKRGAFIRLERPAGLIQSFMGLGGLYPEARAIQVGQIAIRELGQGGDKREVVARSRELVDPLNAASEFVKIHAPSL